MNSPPGSSVLADSRALSGLPSEQVRGLRGLRGLERAERAGGVKDKAEGAEYMNSSPILRICLDFRV